MSQIPKPTFEIEVPRKSRWKIIDIASTASNYDEKFHQLLRYHDIDENSIRSIRVVQYPNWDRDVPLSLLVNYIK